MQPLFPRIKGICPECNFPIFTGGEHKHKEGMEAFLQRIVSPKHEEFVREEILPKDGSGSGNKII